MTTQTQPKSVQDLATYAKVSVKEIIAKLTDEAPDVNWKATTPVPDKLVDIFMKGVDEYREVTPEPIGALTSTEPANMATMRVNIEASQYGLLEALSQVNLEDIINTAIAQTLQEIETFEGTRSQIWNSYLNGCMDASDQRAKALADKINQQTQSRQQGISDRMKAVKAAQTRSGQGVKRAQDFLAQTLASM